MEKFLLSAVVLTKNEEGNIQRCLKSLHFADEIIIIDDFSTDKTAEISESYGATVYKRALDGDFASQRNFALDKASGGWTLFVDADEEVTQELQKEIAKLLNCSIAKKNNIEQCFRIKRRDFFWGKELRYGETKKARDKGIIRLVKKDSGKWIGRVHEEYKVKSQSASWRTNVKCLRSYLNHYPHSTVKNFLQEVNFYSSLRAKELLQDGKTTNVFEIVALPFFKFILTYFIKLGFLDGPAGFAYAFFMSFHSFLVRAKLYQYRQINA